MKRILFFLILTMMGCTLKINAEQKVHEYTLKNGLKVFFVTDPSASLISVRTLVRAGSINEDPHLGAGLSHYLEHLVAGGTTKMKKEKEYKALISKLGGAYNAYTTIDHTSYFINTVPKYLKQSIEILYEWMFFCSFTDREFNRERDVIIREIEKNNADIDRKFYYLAQSNLYKHHPIRYPVIGYLPNFQNITKQILTDYYKSRYVPSNMVLVIGGNFNEKTVLGMVKETFGSIERSAPPRMVTFKEPRPFATRVVKEEGDTHTTLLNIRFSTTDLFSPNLYPLDLLEFMFANGEDAILYKTLVEKKKLAYSVSAASYTPSVTSGYFGITLEIDNKNKRKIIDEVLSLIQQIKEGKFKDELVTRAKKQKISEDIFTVTNVEDKVYRVGLSYIYAHSKNFYDQYLKFIKQVTKKDIVDAAKKYLLFDRMIITILKPEKIKTPEKTTKTPQKATTITPTLYSLENGLRVLLYPEKSLPRVFCKLFTLGGMRAETPTKNGIGSLSAGLLGKNSKLFNKQRIKSLVEDNGATMSGGIGNNTMHYSLDCLSDDLEALFPLFCHTFLEPNFQKEELTELKRKTNKWIEQREDHWYSYAYYHFKKTIFKDHPYALPSIGEKESLKNIQLSDINAYHKKLINPENMVLSIYGDFDHKKIKKEIEKTFSNLKKPSPAYNPNKTLSRIKNNTTKHYNLTLPQKDVTAVLIGFDGLTFDNQEDAFKMDLVDAILSGMNYPGGRLHNILREKGLVYVVHGIGTLGLKEPGCFLIYALTSKEKAETVKNIILDEIKSIQNKLVSKTEFEEAIAQMQFYYKDRISSLESLAVISSVDELYKRGATFYTSYEEQIKKLKIQDIQITSKKYLMHPQIFIFTGEENE